MNKLEAAVIVSLEQYEDLETCYEEKLFEYKQFFTQKTIVGPVFRSKLDKARQLKEAFDVLGVQTDDAISVLPKAFESDASIKKHVDNFEQFKADYKAVVTRVLTFDSLEQIIPFLLEQFYAYARTWSDFEEYAQPLLGKEPDPMDFYQAVKSVQAQGIETWEDLKKSTIHLPSAFCTESKRLYLLAQKEEEWMTSLNA